MLDPPPMLWWCCCVLCCQHVELAALRDAVHGEGCSLPGDLLRAVREQSLLPLKRCLVCTITLCTVQRQASKKDSSSIDSRRAQHLSLAVQLVLLHVHSMASITQRIMWHPAHSHPPLDPIQTPCALQAPPADTPQHS